MTVLFIGPSDSNGKVTPSYGCGQMDKWRLCFTQNNVKALWGMFMKSWAILGSNIHTFCSRHGTGGKVCNCKFNNLFLGVWCVIEFGHLLMHLHLTYSLYHLWGLSTDGVWILLTHWVWHLDITNMFWLWLNISPKWLELVPLPDCKSEGTTYAFLDRLLSRFGALVEVLTN
jgi:hypothetical protein